MNILYPRLQVEWLPAMLGYGMLGALFAGAYGVLHDQVTYSISPEYFTRLKFAQFHCANFGWPPRVFVGEIGFLATWWVGFFGGWFLARISVPAFPSKLALCHNLRGFVIIFLCALAASVIGYVIGLLRGPVASDSDWAELASTLGIVDLQSFVRVAYIHNASYLGGLIGLIVAIMMLRYRQKNSRAAKG